MMSEYLCFLVYMEGVEARRDKIQDNPYVGVSEILAYNWERGWRDSSYKVSV